MANPAKLWEYVNTGKIKFSDLNEEGIKTFLDYGYKQGYIKESQLTDKAKILLGIRQPLSEQRKVLEAEITPPSYLMGSPSSVLPQKVTQPKVIPSVGIEKRETLKAPPSYLMGSPSEILSKKPIKRPEFKPERPELKPVEPASYLMGHPSDILPKVENIKEEELKIEKPKKEVPLTQMAGSPRELMKELGYKLPETKEPSYSEVFTRSLAAGATETTGSLVKVGELIWEGSRRLWNLIVPESLETPEKNIIGEALKKTREFYEKSTQDYLKDMQGLKGLKKFINIGTMQIPQIAASAMMGFGITGIGAGGQLLRTGSRIPKEILRMIPFGTIAAGGYAAEAEKEGANYTQQVLYGVLGGLGEMATESPVFEGWLSIIEKLGAGELVEAGARNIFQRYGKLGIEWLKNAAKETAQEAAMEPITMLAKRATYDPKAVATMQQMAEAAYSGFAMSTLLGALGLPTASLSRQMAEDAIRNGKQADAELIENIARQMEKDLEGIAEVAKVVETYFEPKKLSGRISSQLGEAAAKDFMDAFERGYINKDDVVARAVVSTYDELMESGYAEAKPEVIKQKAEEVLERKIDTGEIVDEIKQARKEKVEEKPEQRKVPKAKEPKIEFTREELQRPKVEEKPIDKATEARRQKILNTKVNYGKEYGVMTRREFLEARLSEGARVEAVKTKDQKATEKAEKELKRLKQRYIPGVSNPNTPTAKRYHELEKKLEEGIYKTEYRLVMPDDTFYDITKTEYDYGKELETREKEKPKAIEKTAEVIAKDKEKVKKTQDKKQSWEMTWEEYFNDKVKKSAAYSTKPSHKIYEEGKARHERIIRRALEQGKPVPDKVLKDYPELAKEYKRKKESVAKTERISQEEGSKLRLQFRNDPTTMTIEQLERYRQFVNQELENIDKLNEMDLENYIADRDYRIDAAIERNKQLEEYRKTRLEDLEEEIDKLTDEYNKLIERLNEYGLEEVDGNKILKDGQLIYSIPSKYLNKEFIEKLKTFVDAYEKFKEGNAYINDKGEKVIFKRFIQNKAEFATEDGSTLLYEIDEINSFMEYTKPGEVKEAARTDTAKEITKKEEIPESISKVTIDFDSLPASGFRKGNFQITLADGISKKTVEGYIYKDFGIQKGTKNVTYIPAGALLDFDASILNDAKRAAKFIADMTEHISGDVSKFREYILHEKPAIYSLAKKIAKGLPEIGDIDKAEYVRSVLTPEEAKIYVDYINRSGITIAETKEKPKRTVQARQILKKGEAGKIKGDLAGKYIPTYYWIIAKDKAPKSLVNLYDKLFDDLTLTVDSRNISKWYKNMEGCVPAVVEDVQEKNVVLRDGSGNIVRVIDKKYYDYFTRHGFEFGLKEGQDLIAITKNGEIAGVVISKRVPESAVERFAPKGGYVIRAEQPKLTKEKLISKEEVIRVIEESFGIPVRHGRYIGKALGIYKVKPEIIRTKTANDIYVVAHELGHHLHLQSLLDMPKKPNTKIADELKALARNVKGAPLKEGFSEFIRLYLTNEGIAQQTAPNLYNEFNQKITAFPEIGDAFDAVREAYKQYSGLSDLEKAQAHIVFDKPKPEQDTSFIDKFYAGCVDDLHMINKKFTELVQGRKVPVGLHPYFRAKLIKGLEGVVGDVLYRGVRDINKRSEIIGPAFKDIVGQFKTREELNDFAVYLVIKHAQELHDLGKKTGLEDVNLSEALNELDAKYGGLDKFEQSARQLYDFIDAVLRGTLLSSGIISQETYNILRKTYPLYVPFYRLMDDKQGTLSKGRSYVDLPQPIKRLKGSGRRILNPIETLILNTYTFYSIAERNNIARLFIEWEETLPGRGKLVEKVSPTLKPFTFKVEEIEKTLLKNTDLPPDAFAEVQDLTITLFRALHHSIPKENISTVFIDGQHVMYQFDPEIYDALKGMTPNTFGALIKILRPFTIMLRTGATKNLDFPFTNVIKDQLEATVFSKYGYIPILDFLRGVASYIKHDKYLSDYFASGAAHASIVSLDRDYLSGAVRKLAKLPRTPGEIVMAPVEFLQAILEGSEIPTRLGEFKRGIQKEAKNVAEERKTALENRNKYYELHQKALVEGRHPQEIKQLYAEYSYWNKVYNYLETYTAEEILFRAGVAAKEVTIDFTRIGKNVKDINAVRAFFNPSIQGIDKIARSFRENPKKMLFRVGFYIILPSLLAYLINRDNEWYKERPRWEKDYYMLFPITADGRRFLRIPRGHMLGIMFGALTQRFLEYIDQKDPEALDEIGETVMNELLLDLVPQDKFTLFKIGPIPIGFPQGLIPDGIKTAMEIYANMSTFTDTPIIPVAEEHLEPFMQYGPYTPEILKTLGRTFGFSPRKVEHAIRGYTGGLGKNVLDILDFLTRPVGKETAPPEGAVEVLEDIPGIRRFIAQPLTASQSATINRFYKDYSRAETVYRTAKAYAERTGKPYIPKTKEDRELLQQYKTLERIRNNLSSIRKSIANIQNLADMPPKEKKEAIEKLNTLMIDLVREYYGKKKLR